MITLFHMNGSNSLVERDLRFPMTDEMANLSQSRHESVDANERNILTEQLRKFEIAERVTAASDYFLMNGYTRVAEIDGDDLDFAYHVTQNGALTDSWSQEPLTSVHPCEPSFHLLNGKRYGRKSTEIGDILLVNNEKFYVVDTYGFLPLDLTVAQATKVLSRSSEAAIILGGTNYSVALDSLKAILDDDNSSEKIRNLDENIKNWRDLTHPNGMRMFAADGTLLNEQGNRSIFDDVDE